MQMSPVKNTVFIYISSVWKGRWVFIPTRLSLFRFMFVYLSLHVSPSALSLLPIWMFDFSLTPTPHSLASPRAFIVAGCFLYENTPIGRQAPLSDTIHRTCIDMKSVLTSTTEFCGAVETAYQWQCRFCDQIKEAVKFGDSYVDILVRH